MLRVEPNKHVAFTVQIVVFVAEAAIIHSERNVSSKVVDGIEQNFDAFPMLVDPVIRILLPTVFRAPPLKEKTISLLRVGIHHFIVKMKSANLGIGSGKSGCGFRFTPVREGNTKDDMLGERRSSRGLAGTLRADQIYLVNLHYLSPRKMVRRSW